jgi:hypothetical protein
VWLQVSPVECAIERYGGADREAGNDAAPGEGQAFMGATARWTPNREITMKKMVLTCAVLAFFIITTASADNSKSNAKKPEETKKETTPEYNEVFDFRGIRLGMTKTEFKSMPPPKDTEPSTLHIDGLRDKVVSVAPECSDDENASSSASEIRYASYKDLGVVTCAWVVSEKYYSESKYISNLSVGSSGAKSHEFRFIAMPGEKEPKLYEIQIFTFTRAFADTVSLLSEKFGDPAKIEKSTVQNGLGAIFENNTVMWHNSTGGVVLMQRFGDIESGLLQYTLNDHLDYLLGLQKAKKAIEDPKI